MSTSTIEFTVPGAPVPKARPRVASGRAYTPRATKGYEELVAWSGRAAMQGAFVSALNGPVGAELAFTLPWPASWAKERRAAALWPVGRVDVDNLVKAVLDALNGICYADDRQVCSLLASKRYGVAPGVLVRLWGMEP